ncbi:MAG: hypothetical protein R6X08_03250 [Desulfosalsimonadaceae bacterium]
MHTDFSLSTEQLADVARRMNRKIEEGLQADGGELGCIPTYVPVAAVPRKGRLLLVDLGGTNIRCAQALLKNARLVFEKGPLKKQLVRQGSVRLKRNEFLERLGRAIGGLAPDNHLPVGYCFSYPAVSTPDGDAVLLRWTKELFVDDTVGEKVGDLLCRHLAAGSQPWKCLRVRVINDTVAALLAGMAVSDADACIGLVVGTGTNMAIAAEAERIPKIAESVGFGGLLPLNLESGNFFPPELTCWDAKLDANSHNPGFQRFEKAVSGRYLAELFRLAMPEGSMDASRGAAAVFERAYGPAAALDVESRLARQIVERSARLTAAALAGVIQMLAANRTDLKKVGICAEGSVFWGHSAYRETAEKALSEVLHAMGADGVEPVFFSVPHANLLGGAIAGLAE